jgi:hypothetical protein
MLQASGDGNLVLLAGADLRKLPSSGMFFGGPVSDGRYGNVTLDAFDWMTQRKLAAVDVDCAMATLDCMAYVSVANSRWLAIALEKDLSRALLFDFGPNRGKESK